MPESFAQDFDADYERRAADLEHYGLLVERLLTELLEARQISVHSVTHRVKKKSSARDKLIGTRSSAVRLDELTDLLGLRVITYFADQVDDVARVLQSAFDIDEGSSTDKRALLEPDRFGYLSLHYIVSMGRVRSGLDEYSRFAPVKFEIQVRSILQHSWAEIEHDLGYKSIESVPRETRRRFSRLAGLLELVDDEFVALRSSLEKHEKEVGEVVRRGGDAPIDRDSMLALMSYSLVRRTDGAIADRAGARLKKSTHSYADARAREFQQLGFHSVQEISDSLSENAAVVTEFASRWLSRPGGASESPAFNPETGTWSVLPAGISLFYLWKHLSFEDNMVPRDAEDREYIAAHEAALSAASSGESAG